EREICARLEALRPASRDEFMAELAEAIPGLVVAETGSGHPAEAGIRKAGSVAVAALEAETDRPADGHAAQIRIRKCSRRKELGENVHGGEGGRVFHRRQLDEDIHWPGAKGVPDTLVFESRFICCRMWCPVDPRVVKKIETNRDGTVALTEGGVDVDSQT